MYCECLSFHEVIRRSGKGYGKPLDADSTGLVVVQNLKRGLDLGGVRIWFQVSYHLRRRVSLRVVLVGPIPTHPRPWGGGLWGYMYETIFIF